MNAANLTNGDPFQMHQSVSGHFYKCHVLAIVDDEMIVYKWYGKHNQCWHYQVEYRAVVQQIIDRANEML